MLVRAENKAPNKMKFTTGSRRQSMVSRLVKCAAFLVPRRLTKTNSRGRVGSHSTGGHRLHDGKSVSRNLRQLLTSHPQSRPLKTKAGAWLPLSLQP